MRIATCYGRQMLVRSHAANKSIVVVTDGEPTAHFENGQDMVGVLVCFQVENERRKTEDAEGGRSEDGPFEAVRFKPTTTDALGRFAVSRKRRSAAA